MKRPGWTSAAARRLLNMAGTASTVEEAVYVVAKRFLKGIHSPPTDFKPLMTRLNITGVSEEDFSGSGELQRDGRSFKIICSSHLSATRKRFTIAHEIAHVIFETTGQNCPRSGTELERLCDMLASEIILPTDVFSSECAPSPSLSDIFHLAKTFAASVSATTIRYCKLKKLSAFEIENGAISWSYGHFKQVDEELKSLVDEVLSGKKKTDAIYLNTREWKGEWSVEGVPLGRARALVLLRPIRREGRFLPRPRTQEGAGSPDQDVSTVDVLTESLTQSGTLSAN